MKNKIIVVAFTIETYIKFMEELKFPHYELRNFFEIEKMQNLEEVQRWWEDKSGYDYEEKENNNG